MKIAAHLCTSRAARIKKASKSLLLTELIVKRKRRDEQEQEQNKRKLAEARRIKLQEKQDLVAAAGSRIGAAKDGLKELHTQLEKANATVAAQEALVRDRQATSENLEDSLKDLKATIDAVKADIARFEDEHEFYEKKKTGLDSRGIADIAEIQTRLRASLSDAIRGQVSLDEALHTEQTRLAQAQADLEIARQRRAKAIQRLEELQDRMQPLEKQIAEDVLTMNVAQSALEALSSAAGGEGTQEPQKVQER
jgi:chromosome segregation ATPase